eukprot:TRINITY_DN120_c0_g1_i2.p1 TRINITY_DN120_c0_g1~~TRINITY_DN120_c0_g1_i2.p1  ORF type:complete len:1182 (+),score=291.70 TRINITY_DN120_c0_g1_i2:824-4369(+)
MPSSETGENFIGRAKGAKSDPEVAQIIFNRNTVQKLIDEDLLGGTSTVWSNNALTTNLIPVARDSALFTKTVTAQPAPDATPAADCPAECGTACTSPGPCCASCSGCKVCGGTADPAGADTGTSTGGDSAATCPAECGTACTSPGPCCASCSGCKVCGGTADPATATTTTTTTTTTSQCPAECASTCASPGPCCASCGACKVCGGTDDPAAAVVRVLQAAPTPESYMVPIGAALWSMYYNKAVFAAVGITDVPNIPSWSQFIGWCAQLKAAGYKPIITDATNVVSLLWESFITLRLYGIDHYRQVSNGNVTFTGDKWTRVQSEVQSLYSNGYLNHVGFGFFGSTMEANSAAMLLGGDFIRLISGKNVDMGVFRFPEMVAGQHINEELLNLDGLVLPKNSLYPDEANRVATYLSSQSSLAKWANLGFFPMDQRLWTTFTDPVHIQLSNTLRSISAYEPLLDANLDSEVSARMLENHRALSLGQDASSFLEAMEAVRVEVYTGRVAAPTITPPGGSYSGSTVVTLTTLTAGADIYYTTDGSRPDESSSQYTAPFTLSGDEKFEVRAVATKLRMKNSAISSARFTIGNPGLKKLLAILIPVVTVVVIGILAVWFYFWRRLKLANQMAWLIDADDVELLSIIGKGASGTVYRGLYRGTDCAVKALSTSTLSREDSLATSIGTFTPTSSFTLSVGTAKVTPDASIASLVEEGAGQKYRSRYRSKTGTAWTSEDGTDMRSAHSRGSYNTAKALQEFREEIAIVSKLRHPNVLFLFGAYEKEKVPYMVTEYAPNGSLFEVLHNPGHVFGNKKKAEFARQIADGLVYLHNQKPPIVHRDLKSLNVLVDASMVCKVADFGMASFGEKGSGMSGTLPWMAPELMKGGHASTSSDVYSFAIVMWEIMSRKEPYLDLSTPKEMTNFVRQGGRPPVLDTIPGPVKTLMEECWDPNPDKRPTMPQVLDRLAAIIVELPDDVSHSESGRELLTVFTPAEREAGSASKTLEHVSIFFSDIVNFTAMSAELPAGTVSEIINTQIKHLDELAKKHHITKYDTIGDAYLAIAGHNPEVERKAQEHHTVRILRFAKDVIAFVKNFPVPEDIPVKYEKLSVRVGCHSGEVVASMVGSDKVQLLGDTMNTASRMESNSEPNKIHITTALRDDASSRYPADLTFISRGEISVKGKGIMSTYFVQ